MELLLAGLLLLNSLTLYALISVIEENFDNYEEGYNNGIFIILNGRFTFGGLIVEV